ncbi:hypothetical protein FLJC2902T_29710 [Flavobacterium limnosediminis JC2902]|uniref:Glycosyltransferase 2-like domain-containing protein n=1 Tax=Flavobacterium limnosediminis JC2902 TaxID=1341181 RepID=V6SNF7_9FLAO|nr:glycosyltransferase family A protein [Flavobacterium limnosediminis]ESU25960.1 hypothetical protein FLJC2902T_29710 [Flavobacterium limnosediminis JC2902]
MRVGTNPNKENPVVHSDYLHQVIIPVYIPNQEGYFEGAFSVFKLCLESLFKTIHDKTFITIVNNGCCDEVRMFIDGLFLEKKIQEAIHTENIGKLNAIYKGLVGNNIELVTISDADVLFLPNWQSESIKVFRKIPKAGVVGIVPQFSLFKSNSENILRANFFSSRLKFLPVKSPNALIRFYDSIGWKRDYNPDYLKNILGLEYKDGFKVIIGSGHFVATYKKSIFTEIQTYNRHKMGSKGLNYLDTLPLLKDYWRLTTYENNAYHMGNVSEQWMYDLVGQMKPKMLDDYCFNFTESSVFQPKWVLLRNKIFRKLVMNKSVLPLLYAKWQLPKKSIKNY